MLSNIKICVIVCVVAFLCACNSSNGSMEVDQSHTETVSGDESGAEGDIVASSELLPTDSVDSVNEPSITLDPLDPIDPDTTEISNSPALAQALPRPSEITLDTQNAYLIDHLNSTVVSMEVFFPENTDTTVMLNVVTSNEFRIKSVLEVTENFGVNSESDTYTKPPFCDLTNQLSCSFDISPTTHSVQLKIDVESLETMNGKNIVGNVARR